ncbi:MAG: chromosomal replication initiator protein DnaA [Pyrinomonadaceae bacterium]
MNTTSTNGHRVWEDILLSIEKKLNKQGFDAWFRQIRFVALDDGNRRLLLAAPNQIVKDWVSSNYSSILRSSLEELGLASYIIDWSIEELLDTTERYSYKQPEEIAGTTFFNGIDRTVANFSGSAATSQGIKAHESVATVNNGSVSGPVLLSDPLDFSLNPKYTFQTFVVGSCNQFAHAAALAVAELPGKTYNPLYIYGGVGLGKTHLTHAIGHSIKERNRALRLSYISAEKFMNELINAIRYDKTHSFREKYRSIDVMLMDDVQFMAGKERTQEEFFHTFNALYDAQRQIVITSDCPPRGIPTLEERLHSRFEWGLIADMEPPDLETKVAILKRKADLDGVDLPDDVALFIASKIKSNIRELEGSLVRLVAIASLRGMPISKALAQDAVRNIASDDQPSGVTIEQIQKIVSAHFRLRVEELKSKNNSRQISFPRQIAMYLCKRLTKHSYPEIGRDFAGKHHTTVMHSVEKIESLVATDTDLNILVNNLIETLSKY